MAIFNSEFRDRLKGRRIAILATVGFEEVELTKPKKALEDAGATVDIIAPKSGIKSDQIKAWDMTDWGGKVKVDVELSAANSSKYDGLHLPGGVMNPDHLRMDPQAVSFVKNFFT
jgi:protease I